MKIRLLLIALLALAVGCTPSRGGGGGGDDDDDDGGNNNGSGSTAWVRTTTEWDGEISIEHNLVTASFSGICNAMRTERTLFQELYETWDAGFEDIEEEFGEDEEAPGYQEAYCELEKDYYAGIVAADLAMLQQGAWRTSIGLRGLDDTNSNDLPAGEYSYDAESNYFWGSGFRMDDTSWFTGWANVDCNNVAAFQDYSDNSSGMSYWELQNGSIWVSAPSSNTRGATAEDVDQVDEETEQVTTFTLDEEFDACDIDDTDDN